jgi:hypothetical protein
VHSGVAAVGDKLLLGPDRFGSFKRVIVTSIHVSRRAVTAVAAGRTATFTLRSSHTRHSSGDSYNSSSSSSDEQPISSAVYTATTVATSMADSSSSSSDDASTDVFGAIEDFTDPVCSTSSLESTFSGLAVTVTDTITNGAAVALQQLNGSSNGSSSGGATTAVSARAKRRAKQLASCSSAPSLTAHSRLLQSSTPTTTTTTAASRLIDDDVAELFVKEQNSPRKGGPGLVLLHDSYAPTASFEFSAEVVVLHHPSAIYAR